MRLVYDCAGIPTKGNNWSGSNMACWCNKVADEALQQSEGNIEVTLSREKRKPYIEKFFQEWTKDVPGIPLYNYSIPIMSGSRTLCQARPGLPRKVGTRGSGS